MKSKLKIPLFCKIKKHLAIPSPSGFYYCGNGYSFRPRKLCNKCPLQRLNQ